MYDVVADVVVAAADVVAADLFAANICAADVVATDADSYLVTTIDTVAGVQVRPLRRRQILQVRKGTEEPYGGFRHPLSGQTLRPVAVTLVHPDDLHTFRAEIAERGARGV